MNIMDYALERLRLPGVSPCIDCEHRMISMEESPCVGCFAHKNFTPKVKVKA